MRSRKLLWSTLSVTFFLLCLQGISLFAREYQKDGATCNSEGPFGIQINFWLILIAFFAATWFFLRQWWGEEGEKAAFLWLLLIAAGASNLLERLFFGCVFDFLALPFLPLFNGADVVLTVSVIFLLWWEVRRTS